MHTDIRFQVSRFRFHISVFLLVTGYGSLVTSSLAASDDASASAYSDGWQTGDNGGSGFGPWLLRTSSADVNNAGFFAGSSTNNGGGGGPGIDTDGRAWGTYANNTNATAAYRAFGAPLATGETFRIDMDNGWIDTGKTVGFALRNGNANGSYTNYNTSSRFELYFLGGATTYYIVDRSGISFLNLMPFTDGGLQISFRLIDNDGYVLAIRQKSSGIQTVITGQQLGTNGVSAFSSLDSVVLYNRGAGPGSQRDAFFNAMGVQLESTHYVALSGNHVFPFISWPDAATNIQAAVDASFAGDTVWVTNGLYGVGGRKIAGGRVTNRVVITNSILVQSVNGPAVTTIRGKGPQGADAVRCVFMTNGATLSGFTLTNGFTRSEFFEDTHSGGGGVYAVGCTVSNSVLTGNGARNGGGALGGTLNNCTLIGNLASNYGGGAAYSLLNMCTVRGNTAGLGGGAYSGTLYNCTISGNAAISGGGSIYATLSGCVITGNMASVVGGGTFRCTLTNCLLIGNSASNVVGTTAGGGAYNCTMDNCQLIGNVAFSTNASYGGGAFGGTLNHCMVSGNSAAQGGGTRSSIMKFCTLSGNSANAGGGVYDGNLINCTVSGNSATFGGGAQYSRLKNCMVTGNSASEGGGIHEGEIQNCTIAGNSATNLAGGVYHTIQLNGPVRNCIVVSNAAPVGPNYLLGGGPSNMEFSCTAPMPTNGVGNITNDPQFVDYSSGDLRLKASSPCIDRGLNESWMFGAVDFGGNTRIINGMVDQGAYEMVFEASLKAFLQGAYDTNSHRMTGGPLPLIRAPYAADARTAAFIPTNATDWVSVELRRETNSATVYTRSAWLRDDGMLMSDTGAPPVTLEAGTGTYFMVLRHRNHLAVMTATPLAFTNRQITYDFTTSAEQNYGGTNSAIQVETNIWALIAGDADGDGKILPTDELIWRTQKVNP